MRSTIRIAALACFLFCLVSQVSAQELVFPRFTLKPGKLDADGLPLAGARLCTVPEADHCFVMPSEHSPGSDSVKYDFALEPRSERLALATGGSWIFFSSMFSGGGSGTLTRLAVLRYAKSGTLENLLPYVAVTNVSDFAMWSLSDISPYPLLVDADFIWDIDHGETHFSPHRFLVEAFRFEPHVDRYVKVLSYKTTKKYDGGDSSPVRVLNPEREEIVRRLHAPAVQ